MPETAEVPKVIYPIIIRRSYRAMVLAHVSIELLYILLIIFCLIFAYIFFGITNATLLSLIIFTILLIGTSLIKTYFLIQGMVTWVNTSYAIFEDRIDIQRGETSKSHAISDVQATIKQNALERLIDAGTLILHSKSSGEKDYLLSVATPTHYATIINEMSAVKSQS